jgi:RHH-type proline utilization regulon transcriptional repressor/proline dehydrogenase/delta 1-pyrroline-5-carboxylate dehydrogenase
MLTENELKKTPSFNDISLDGKLEGWSVVTYLDYDRYFSLHKKELLDKLENLKKYAEAKGLKSFRYHLEINTMQFFCGVFIEDKKFYILSKQLSRELTYANAASEFDHRQKDDEYFETINKLLNIPVENTPKVIDYLYFVHDLGTYIPDDKLELETQKLTHQLVGNVNKYRHSFFEKLSDFGLNLTASYELVRIHLLKFLAILPCLDHDKKGTEVRRILIESLERFLEDNQKAREDALKGQRRALSKEYDFLAKITLRLVRFFPAAMVASVIRWTVSLLAKRFIAGRNMNEAKSALTSLKNTNRDATIDQLGELVVSKEEADNYCKRVLKTIKSFDKIYKKGSRNAAGILQAHVSIKVTALAHDFKPMSFDYCYQQIAPRLKEILLTAKEHEVFINIDAEHYHYRNMVLRIYEKVLLETSDLQDFDQTGIVLQGYLRDSYEHLQDILSLAKKRKLVMPIRLVKGAYWDAETIEATAHNFIAPQFLNKEETDLCFRMLIKEILKEKDFLQLTVASHNIQDHCYARALHSERFNDSPEIEHQCLHMTYEALSCGLSKMGWPTRNYIPVGDLLIGMAYLVRRIIENSSQVGVLTIMRSHKKVGQMMSAHELHLKNSDYVYDDSVSELNGEFRNIYPIRSYLEQHMQSFSGVYKDVKTELLQEISQKVYVNDHNQRIKDVKFNSKDEVISKIEKLHHGFFHSPWKLSLRNRVSKLLQLADLLLIHRERLTSIIMLEAGKTIDEAIADVDEAIDFINFYVRVEVRNEKVVPNLLPKGLIGVIAPWNFPLAIAVGMSTGALVSGNTVILKPAEQTSLIIDEFLKLAREVGITEDIFDVAFGDGDIGAVVSDHKLLSGLVFTGSKEVGTMLFKKFNGKTTLKSNQEIKAQKTIITEMGGKNAIIVTNNCELDETVSGIIYAAYAHAGQKCSACSRVIIDKKIKEAFLKRFIEASNDTFVGSSEILHATINPLISKEDQDRVRNFVKDAVKEAQKYKGKVHLDRSHEKVNNNCVGPAIIELPKTRALNAESFAMKEAFGPVVHIIEYSDLDEAIEIFNSTEYALTGGIFAQSQYDIDHLVPHLLAGNIYINRPNTGARVAIEPFGGFKMSGTGPKAGSAQYVSAFQYYENMKASKFLDYDLDDQRLINDIPVFSTLSIIHKKEILQNISQAILKSWADILDIFSEDDKNNFKELISYLVALKTDFNETRYYNRNIPGQLSFDYKNQKLKTGLIISHNDHVTAKMLLHITVNLFLGNAVSIIVNNVEASKRYAKLANLLYSNGISITNFQVNYLSSFSTINYLKKYYFDFYLFDTNIENFNDLGNIINENDFHYALPKLYFMSNLNDSAQAEEIIDHYIHRRSLAINTMRHGAPMELVLDEPSLELLSQQ